LAESKTLRKLDEINHNNNNNNSNTKRGEINLRGFNRVSHWPRWFGVLIGVSLCFLIFLGPTRLANNGVLLGLYLLPLLFGLYFLISSSETNTQIVQAFSRAIEYKDEYTRGHSLRVAKYAQEIAKGVSRSPELGRRVFIAGLLHDIGKIGIPDVILKKSGGLTLEERRIIQNHSELGAGILQEIRGFQDIIQMILDHHERWDGSGYPQGKKGEEISFGGRILAVADAYDAMTSKRSYRGAISQEQALEELIRCSKSQFDPKVIEALVRKGE